MERAEALQHQAASHPQLAAESRPPQPQQDPMEAAIATLPARAQRWYRAHPELCTDPEKAAQVQYAHWVAKRETGEELTDSYFDRMEHLLGFRQPQQPKPASNEHAHARPPENNQTNGMQAPPRHSAPPRQQQQRPASAPVSAPPTRSVPSMSTGRPTSHRVPLTEDELAIAKNSGISPQEYADQKEKMLRLKAAGAVQ
jgi:hypothetical protein